MNSDLNDVVILVDDYIAQKIVAIWSKVQDCNVISKTTGLPVETVEKKISNLIELGIIDEQGNVSEYADKLVKARASRLLKSSR